MKSTRLLSMAIVLAALSAPWVSAQRPSSRMPPLVISSMSGRDLFNFYCASCHGRDGYGGGPVARALKHRVPDLTMLASREGGVFPRARVRAIVTGDQTPAIAAHGSAEMPVWGPIFRALDGDAARTAIRIDNVVAYVGSLQSGGR